MEELIDFDEWLENYVEPEIEYVAVYEPSTGFVKSVGPSHAFENEHYKIPLDKEIAESILTAEIQIHHCLVDINLQVLEIAEIKNLTKIDDVLHRIISVEYSTVERADIYLTYDNSNKTLTVELSEEFGGTKKPEIKVNQRKIVWDGDTEMNFLITDYNDPNVTFEMFSVKINELVGNFKLIENVDYSKFSVYTRRLFKNYVIEYK